MVNGRRRQDARGVNEMSGAGCAQICGACVETVGEGKEQEWERSERCVVCSVWSVCGGAKARFGRSERKCGCAGLRCVCVAINDMSNPNTPSRAAAILHERRGYVLSHT